MIKQTRHRSGFTLLEMLIVGMLGVLIAGFIGHTWRWYSRSMSDLQALTLLTKELKIATEAIAQDYGPALASRSVDGETLQLDIDAGAFDGVADWDAPDTVIEYTLDEGKLLRRDLSNNTQVPIASQISEMQVSTVDDKVQVRLVVEIRNLQQDITLQLQGP